MMTTGLKLADYRLQLTHWPKIGRVILAQFDDDSVVVYQAFNNKIADAALVANNFHVDEVIKAGYNTDRMTWIKTNFLWMMYRSGWASKPSQERILAITMTRKGFDEILLNAAIRGKGSVRIQWDPDHNPDGSKVPLRRAIQLGLRNEMLQRFSRDFIIKIEDFTNFVKEQVNNISENCESLLIPEERIYLCSPEIATNIGIHNLL